MRSWCFSKSARLNAGSAANVIPDSARLAASDSLGLDERGPDLSQMHARTKIELCPPKRQDAPPPQQVALVTGGIPTVIRKVNRVDDRIFSPWREIAFLSQGDVIRTRTMASFAANRFFQKRLLLIVAIQF